MPGFPPTRVPEQSIATTLVSVIVRTAGLLVLSNRWGIAFFEYLLQVPANRIGYTALSLGQPKIMQEVITLIVFVPFAAVVMRQPLRLDFVWAGLCLCGAVYFVFRGAA